MTNQTIDLTSPHGGVEIRAGLRRRRRWPEPEKGRIVAESFAPDAVVSEIARRYQISPRQLSTWRKAAREDRLALPGDATPPFVPVIAPMPIMKPSTNSNSTSIAIEIAGAVVRAGPGVDLGLLRDVLRAVVKAAT